jgi:FkbM family methyltransferase
MLAGAHRLSCPVPRAYTFGVTMSVRGRTSQALKSAGRFAVPAGALDVLRVKRNFEQFGQSPSEALRSALSPAARHHLEVSRLGSLPSHLLRRPPAIIDVGAQIGTWTEAVLALSKPERLIAVEPTPDSFRQLETRIGAAPGVELLECAVGANAGTAEFRIMSDSLFNSFLSVRDEVKTKYDHVAETGTVKVEVRTLDDITAALDRVTILKIDVQGTESAVMDGGRETLAKTSVVVLEANFLSHYDGDTCFDKLHARMSEEFGFELYRYVGPYHQHGQVLFADALYIRPAEIKRAAAEA